MPNRLIIAASALAAAVAISAVAVSVTGTRHGAPVAGSNARTGGAHQASASMPTMGTSLAHSSARAAHSIASGTNASRVNTGLDTRTSAGEASSASTPTLLTTQGTAHTLAGGAQKATPVAVSEDGAMQAIFKGGMWLPNANGGREYAKYDHHLIHSNGDWTWVGKVQTNHGMESAVITFGKDAVFGRIPQASGYPLRLVTAEGQKLLVQTDGAKMAASAQSRQLYARQDFIVPQHTAASSQARASSASSRPVASSSKPVASAATASGGTTIDVMVAYTNGYASAQGGTSATLTRIDNLVDVTNQAYVDSGVNQQIRLVYTMPVGYTDTNDNTQALDDVTGRDGDGNILPVPSSLQGIAGARTQYGADLVVLLRKYNNAGNNGCGVGWLLGGDLQGIDPSLDSPYGYSVVQDGQDGGYYCLDTTFAHELGHNMGSAHDRANADKDSNGNPIPGAYSYSFGYLGNGTDGFATIMAYGSDTQTPVNYFSNPNISKCQNTPCGVADTASNSADNAHSLNNTASLVAQFEPTKVGSAGSAVHNDVDGDGHSDLLFQNPSRQYFGWWLMNGTKVLSLHNQKVAVAGYTVVATGDFNGDGEEDIVWTNSANAIYIWYSNGSGGFNSPYVGTFGAGWQIVGAADVDGDGKADLLFQNPTSNYFGWWLMDGTKVLSTHNQTAGAGYRVAAVGDFNGDARADIAWTNAGHTPVIWLSSGNGFAGQHIQTYGGDWQLVGAGDVNGDGNADLLFQNLVSHNFEYWAMNGSDVLSTYRQVAGAGYSVGATGDFNADGKTDVAWANASGALVIWTSTGTGFSGQHIQSLSSGWKMVP